jgi:hypothetical protein
VRAMGTSKILVYLDIDMCDLYGCLFPKYYEFSDMIANSLENGWFRYGITEYGPDKANLFIMQVKKFFPTAFVPLFRMEIRALPPIIHDDLGGVVARWRLRREDRFLDDYRYNVTRTGDRIIVNIKDEFLDDLLYATKTPEIPREGDSQL